MKRLFALLMGFTILTGCSSSTSQYYEAVQKTAEANARAHEAKMTALASMAASSDAGAQGAAVMAMALTQAPVVTPQYIESSALSWARVLSAPTAAVAGLYLQTDLAKHQSDNTARVQLGQQQVQINADNTNADTILGVGNIFSEVAISGGAAVADVAISGFNALNTAGDQTVGIATVGYQTVEEIVAQYTQSLTTVATQTPTVVNPLVVDPVIVQVPQAPAAP